MSKTLKSHLITRKIIKGYYEVYNELGTGFLESVYQNAMFYILRNELKLDVVAQAPLKVKFRNIIIGDFYADLLVENKIIVELKAVSRLINVHKAQMINYLKASEIELGLLMNFGEEPEFKRVIFSKHNATE